ncbi:MAG: flagellar protein FliS [Planctomycetaceae bacterium]
MESAHSAYRKSKATSLTRIDMLIALYDRTLKTLNAGIESQQSGDDNGFISAQLTAYRCILALLDGIDADRDEVSANIQRLCLFAASRILEGTTGSWQDAIKVLQPLHNSFVQIREEAVQLELNGQIPALNFQSVVEHSVV